MTITNTIKKVIIASAVILILWFLYTLCKDWLKPTLIKALGGYTQKETKTTIDTLEVKYKDIYMKYKKLQTKAVIDKAPEYLPDYKYTTQTNTNKLSTTGKVLPSTPVNRGVMRYQTAINDSILTGNIETLISIDSCKIVSQTLNYEPKIPYIREKIITVVKTVDNTVSDKPKAYIGLGLDINTINQITPQALYLTKKKWLYKGGYTKSLDNKFPAAITVGIAKLF